MNKPRHICIWDDCPLPKVEGDIFYCQHHRVEWQKIERDLDNRRRLYGFEQCPECRVWHNCKTLTCRACNYKAQQPP